MPRDYVEDELSRHSVFKSEQFLSADYVPETLPHREPELRTLAQAFKTLITSPGHTSQKFIIEGPVGSGKTAVAKRFSEQMVQAASRRGIRLHKLHINCRVNKSTYLVYLRILREFNSGFPRRGHSPEEILQMVLEVIDSQDRYLMLILDELDYFIKQRGAEILYDLTRLIDDRLNAPQRISIIGVGRDIALDESSFDRSILSTLQRNILRFDKYDSEALCDILKDRVVLAFQPNVVMDETLQVISDIASERGDARYAIELLWRAGKQADRDESKVVVPDYARQAKADTHPELRKEVFTALPVQSKLLLLAASRSLKEIRSAYATIGEVEEMYRTVCEEYGVEPRAHTQVWEWVQDLNAHGLIDTRRSGAGQRGQTTLVGLSDVPADMLERFLLDLLQSTQGS
ncbi:MAG: orc1/cdc6 family replication initiation protein [Candidatus Thorarchaeota archaeon]|nr:MAG: orc1/cdc6 family replication initiation protein [Candidatus Thorarchaeota archaeon]